MLLVRRVRWGLSLWLVPLLVGQVLRRVPPLGLLLRVVVVLSLRVVVPQVRLLWRVVVLAVRWRVVVLLVQVLVLPLLVLSRRRVLGRVVVVLSLLRRGLLLLLLGQVLRRVPLLRRVAVP